MVDRVVLTPGEAFTATLEHDDWENHKTEDMYIKWRRNTETNWQKLYYNQSIEIRGEGLGSGRNASYTFVPFMTKPIIERTDSSIDPYRLAPERGRIRVEKIELPHV
jgi:hypothetical protein